MMVEMLKTKIKKILKAVALALIAIFLIIFLGFYRPVSLWGDTRYEPVRTGSMEPAIPVGSIVVIKPADPDTLKVGDIICFKIESESSTTVTHRIFNITDKGFITKGDANEDPDQWIVKKENVIGKVIAVIPLLGYLGYFVRTPVGFILLIIIPATIIIIMEIRNIIKELKKNKASQHRQAK
jgi:signal peptidase